MGFKIALDGPSGAGKSTIAKKVSQELGYIYVDTGALYRAIALAFLSAENKNAEEVLQACDVTIRYEDNRQRVFLNGCDVTERLREEAVGNKASQVSARPDVREKLLGLQRDLGETYNVVMDGRDIGTHVFPNADIKIYLTADAKERADRRYRELLKKGKHCDRETIEKDIIERDQRDMTREIAPLKRAEDAVYVDSTHMTIDEVVETIIKVVREAK